MNKIIKRIAIALLVIAAIAVFWYNRQMAAVSQNVSTIEFIITSGEGTSGIADRLESEKLINSSLAFKVYFYLHKDAAILAGEYVIEPKTKAKDIIAQLSKGEVAGREVSVLIREGLSAREINEYLRKNNFLNDDSFLQQAKKYEGYLFPDTYRMYKGFTAEELIEKMRQNFEKKLTPELRQAMNASGHKPEDIIIMASIVEKEVRTETDRKIVAGIFWHRLKIGQGLQSDATLSYILNSGKAAHTYEETQIDSLYNTYKYRGLPPGPISNPGLVSIKAAIYPTETDYNYFLSRLDTGETIFSRTLDEHNAAKATYLK